MNYIIVTEGRAGSTLLCQHLKQMGIGHPYPHLSSDVLNRKLDSVNQFADYLESKRVNGILGLKISWGILTKLDVDHNLNLNAHEFLSEVCPNAKYLHQTREDRVHQALSRIKHLKMDSSHIKSSSGHEKYKKKETAHLEDMPIPVEEIHDRIQRNIKGYKAWDIYFKAYQITPLEVIFEDLVSNRDDTLEQICNFLEVPLRLDMLEEKLISTHTKVNDKWYDRVLGGYAKYL